MAETAGAADLSRSAGQAVLICGMHRSGTSALTRVYNLLGGALPEPLVPPSIGNEFGHWEPAEVVAMNDRALMAADSDVNSVTPISFAWFRSAAARSFSTDIASYLQKVTASAGTWYIKDPRISLLSKLWRQGLEDSALQPRFIIAFRDPREVASSLSARQIQYFPDEVWPEHRGLALWLNYVLTVEEQTRGSHRSFVSYDRLLADWPGEISRINAQLGLPAPELTDDIRAAVDAFIDPSSRHVQIKSAATENLAGEVYKLLCRMVDDPEGEVEGFTAARKSFDGVLDILGGYIGALERRAAEVSPVKARAERAEAHMEALKHASASSEHRLLHLKRSELANAEPPSTPNSEIETSSKQSIKFAKLEKKHAALIAAHRDNIKAYAAEKAAWQSERDAILREKDSETSDLKAQILSVSRDRLSLIGELQGLTEKLNAQVSSLETANARNLEEPRRLENELDFAKRQMAKLEEAIEASKTLHSAELKRWTDEAASAQHLREELADALAAYEDLRVEINVLREKRDEAERARAGLEAELEQEAVTNLQLHHSALASAEDVQKKLGEKLTLVEAELHLIHRSRSWKLTAPLRSASARLGRS